MDRTRITAARLAAPAAFLLAATIAVLLIRSAVTSGSDAPLPATTRAAATTAAARTTSPPPEPPPAAATTAPAPQLYTIESGDTYESIAEQFGTTVEALFELNPDVDPRALTVGQQIRVE